MFPLAFVARWLQGHWWGFINRNYVVWPTFLLMNVFTALKGSNFWFLFIPCTPILNGNPCDIDLGLRSWPIFCKICSWCKFTVHSHSHVQIYFYMTTRLHANLLSVQICSGMHLHTHVENLDTMQIYTCLKYIHMCKFRHVNDPNLHACKYISGSDRM